MVFSLVSCWRIVSIRTLIALIPSLNFLLALLPLTLVEVELWVEVIVFAGAEQALLGVERLNAISTRVAGMQVDAEGLVLLLYLPQGLGVSLLINFVLGGALTLA